MTGKFPFPDNLSQSELTKKIQEGKFDFSNRVFIDYSERAIDLVKRMLKVDPGRDLKIDAPHLKHFSKTINIVEKKALFFIELWLHRLL